MKDINQINAETTANFLQHYLRERYYNETTGIMNQWYPNQSIPNENFYYWWQAHVIDCFIDGYERTKDNNYLTYAEQLAQNIKHINKDTYLHHYYDDMQWFALALLRLYDYTKSIQLLTDIHELWADIKTAWNEFENGGLCWKKDQLDYKNTPANAPASILAARLYQRFNKDEDLIWALKLFHYVDDHLVDPQSGIVWDGVNRLGNHAIDKDWLFTYCQGVYIGAATELWEITKEEKYIIKAERCLSATKNTLLSPTSLLPGEGIDDTGLFKGIFIRYVVDYILRLDQANHEWVTILMHNTNTLLQHMDDYISHYQWDTRPTLPTQLSIQLSSLMLYEAISKLTIRS